MILNRQYTEVNYRGVLSLKEEPTECMENDLWMACDTENNRVFVWVIGTGWVQWIGNW